MDFVVKEVLRVHWKELKKKANVVGYSGSLMPRRLDSKGIELRACPCFRIYVTRKDRTMSPLSKDFIPHKLVIPLYGGTIHIDTDIVEHDVMKALPLVKTDRPVVAGPSAMAYYPEATACTLGYFGKDNKSRKFGIVCNNHCGAKENTLSPGNPYTYPSKIDGGTINNQVGRLTRFVELKYNGFTCPFRNFLHKIYRTFVRQKANRVDIAFVELTIPLTDVKFEVYGLGKPTGKRRGTIGELAMKCGRTTKITKGAVLIDNDYYGYVQYSRGTVFVGPVGLLEKDNFSAGGDSSSLILWEQDTNLGGFLFAGSNTHTLFCHYDFVEQDLDVELCL